MEVTTKERVKTILKIDTDEIDAQIELLIEMIGALIKRRRNNDFINEETQEVEFPDWLELPAIQLLSYHISKGNTAGVQSESLGDWSISYSVDYPESALREIPRKVRII